MMKSPIAILIFGLALSALADTDSDSDSDSDSVALAAKLAHFTQQEADSTLLELETKLDAEIIRIDPPDPSAKRKDKPVIVDEMEAIMIKVEKTAAKIKNLKGSERAKRVTEWNARHDAMQAKLARVFEKESENGHSDEIAPVLERIRTAFQLEAE